MKKLFLVIALAFISTLAFAGGKKEAPAGLGSLWDTLAALKSDYKWVDLSLDISPDTPHWHGFSSLKVTPVYTFENTDGVFLAYEYTLPGQYGTHADIPSHFDPGGRSQETYTPIELAYPLVVIDKSAAVAANPDYALSVQDILDWEGQYGAIPAGSVVLFRSDWSKRTTIDEYENKDKDGNSHYPGWDIQALKLLVDERNVAAVGHETPDTDPSLVGNTIGFIGEDYVLDHGKLNLEFLKNLDQLPPRDAIIFVTFPRIVGGTGFPSRIFAIAPK